MVIHRAPQWEERHSRGCGNAYPVVRTEQHKKQLGTCGDNTAQKVLTAADSERTGQTSTVSEI